VLGRRIAERLNGAKNDVTVVIPLRGISAIDAPGQPFHDPDADTALFEAFDEYVAAHVTVVRKDAHINDPELAVEMANHLHEHIIGHSEKEQNG
jgi:uncharacterized protein (UPF0261 family)